MSDAGRPWLRDVDRDGWIIDLGSETFIFCSLLRPPNERLLPEEPVDGSLENLVNGSEPVEVSRSTWSSAANVHERTTFSIRLSGNVVS
jgi:hypothetical protein